MKRSIPTLLLILLATAASARTPARAALAAGIEARTLDNGLRILVWPDHDIPNVALFNWIRAGSRNEYPGITGLSHFFEHMMFNGSRKYGPGEFDRVMEANGGRNNAYTNENVTVYQDWFPRTALERIFDLEADRLANLAIDPKVVESERQVVYSERRSSVDNDNQGFLFEQVQATAYLAHPYQFPTIGWPSDIESWSMDDLVRYYRTYYAPNNATLVVVGDVRPAEIFSLAERTLGAIPRQDPPEPVKTREPEQLGERRLTVRRPAQVPLLQIAYHVGAEHDPDSETLDLLLAILTDGDSSRLHRLLVEQERVAVSIGSFRSSGFDPSLAWFFMTLTSGADPAEAERLFDEALARVVKEGVTDAELRKAKNIAIADFWRSMQTISGKAQQLGFFEVFRGDANLLFSAPERYEAVTKEAVQQAAAKYLRKTNRTVGLLQPLRAEADAEESR